MKEAKINNDIQIFEKELNQAETKQKENVADKSIDKKIFENSAIKSRDQRYGNTQEISAIEAELDNLGRDQEQE